MCDACVDWHSGLVAVLWRLASSYRVATLASKKGLLSTKDSLLALRDVLLDLESPQYKTIILPICNSLYIGEILLCAIKHLGFIYGPNLCAN